MSNSKFPYLLVASLTVVCYWNSLDCELVHDDIFAIKENQDLRSGTPWHSLFKNDFWGKPMADNTSHKSYRPLTVATFRLNYSLHGLSPFGYHIVNMILHTVVSVFFFHFCKKNVFHHQKASIFTGLLFSVHPVHTEAVTGVVGRADLLACLLFLISLHIYSRVLKINDAPFPFNNNVASKHVAVSGLHEYLPLVSVIVFGCLGMLCKEQGITVIGVCLCLEMARRRGDFKNFITKKIEVSDMKRINRALLRITILLISAVFLMAFRVYLMNGQLPAFSEEDNPASFSKSIATRLMTYSYLIAFNLQLLLLPSCLSYDWQVGSIPLVESITDVRNLHTAIAFTLMASLALKTLSLKNPPRSENILLLALSLLVIPFIPASNLFFRVGFVVAERILYIPSLGYCILVGHGFDIVSSLLEKDSAPKIQNTANGSFHNKEATFFEEEIRPQASRNASYRKIFMAASAVLIGSFILRTIDRNSVWKNRETLFRSGIEILPQNAKAHYNYANLMKDTGKTNEAIEHYKTAIRLYPKYASSHNNLATLLGKSEEAEYHLKQTLVHNPYHYRAMYNLASLYSEKGKKQQAKILLEKCLSIKPNYYEAVQIFAEVLHDLGHTQQALEIFHNASLQCADANFFNSYGYFLGNIGMGNSSLKAYERAIEIDPKHKLSLVNYGRQLKMMERYHEAESVYRSFINILHVIIVLPTISTYVEHLLKYCPNPHPWALDIKRDPNTLHLLAVLLYQTRRLRECELTFSEALKYEPRNEDYIRNHATAVFEQGLKDEAVDLLKGAMKMLPKSLSITKLLVNFLMTLNRPSEALDAVEAGLSSNPADYELHFLRANAFKDLNNLDLALESYKDAVKLNPSHFSSLQNIGVIYHLKGFKIEAKHFYDKALKIEPDNSILKENIVKLLRTKSRG